MASKHTQDTGYSPSRSLPPPLPSHPQLADTPSRTRPTGDSDATSSAPAPKRARRAAAQAAAEAVGHHTSGAASSDSDDSQDGRNPDRSYRVSRQDRQHEYESDYDIDDADLAPENDDDDDDGGGDEDEFAPHRAGAAGGASKGKGKGKARVPAKGKGKGKGKAGAGGSARLKLSSATQAAYGGDSASASSSSAATANARLPTLKTPGVAAHQAVAGLLNANFRQDRDYGYLPLRPDQASRPFYIVPSTGHIILEHFHPLAKYATDFLVAIAEPVSRPRFIHEYKLTPHSLYAAVSVGLETENIIEVLNRMSKVPVPDELCDFIRDCTHSYGKVKMVLKKNKHFVESSDPDTLRILLRDDVIAKARVPPDEQLARDGAAAAAAGGATFGLEKDKAPTRKGLVIPGTSKAAPGTEGKAGAQEGAGGPAGAQGAEAGAAERTQEEEDLFTAVVGLDKGALSSPLLARRHSLTLVCACRGPDGRRRRGALLRDPRERDRGRQAPVPRPRLPHDGGVRLSPRRGQPDTRDRPQADGCAPAVPGKVAWQDVW